MIDAEGIPVGVGPAAGHRIAEPVGTLHVGPEDAQDLPFPLQQPVRGRQHRASWPAPAPARRFPAARRRRTPSRPRAPPPRPWQLLAGHLPRGPGRAGPPGHAPARPPRPGTSGPPGGRTSRAATCRRAHTCSGLPLSRLSRTAMVALVVAASDSSGIGMAAPARHASTKRGQLGALPLVLAAPGPDRVVTAPGPDRGLAEVVQPRAAAAAGGVQRLLGKARVAAGEVADHAAGAVAEPHRDLDVVGVRAAGRVHLLGQAVRPPAQRVQEVTAFAGEPRPLALVAVPAVRGQRARVDQVAGDRAGAGRAEVGLHLGQHRGEAPVEAHHQPVVAGLGDHLGDPVQLLAGQRERLLHEHRLAGLQRPADQVRVGGVAGHDEDRVQRLVVQHGRRRWSRRW